MFNGAFALLERSLRVDSRSRSSHLIRLGLAGAIYFSLLYALMTSFMFGAPGMHFFTGIVYLDVVFITLLGIGFFSISITEEKEEDFLGLMLMAGISPLGLLIGKIGGGLFQSLLLIAIQFPFVLLAVTLGGVTHSQVVSAMIALLAFLIFLAGFGLLCSTLAPRSRTSTTWMVIGLCTYFVTTGWAWNWYSSHATSYINSKTFDIETVVCAIIKGIAESGIFNQLHDILTTGFDEPLRSTQIITNVLAGVICTGLAWLFFGVATRNLSTEENSRGFVSRKRVLLPFCAGRCWNNPFIWKDFHFVSGGVSKTLIRTIVYGGLGLLGLYFESTDQDDSFATCIGLMWFALPIDAARVLSRSMHDEIRGQTLSSLMMLPSTPTTIVYSKYAGALLAWLPGPLISLLVVVISPAMSEGFVHAITSFEVSFTVFMVIFYFSLIPHFAAVLALYVRWGTVPLAIAMLIAVFIFLQMGIGILIGLLMMVTGGGFGMNDGYLIFGIITVFLIVLCSTCHLAILLRVQALAAK